MRVIISPAKNMKVENDSFAASRLPVFIENTKEICRTIQGLDYEEAKKMWKCSDKIARLNFRRFADMNLYQDLSPAIMAYDGLQYMRMKPSVFTENALDFILLRQEDSDLYRSGMNCRQPVRAENCLTSQKCNDTI